MSRHIAGRGRVGRGTPAQAAPPVAPSIDPSVDASVDDVECDLSSKLTLGQFLKLASLLDSGADAKEAVASGEVTVNDEVDVRRGRGLVDGDVVTFASHSARVVAQGGAR